MHKMNSNHALFKEKFGIARLLDCTAWYFSEYV